MPVGAPAGSTAIGGFLYLLSTGINAGFDLYGSVSGHATVTTQNVAGTPTLTIPNTSGTFAVVATPPLMLDAVTGTLSTTLANITCTKYTVPYSDPIFMVAAKIAQKTLFQLPARAKIMGTSIKHSSQFTSSQVVSTMPIGVGDGNSPYYQFSGGNTLNVGGTAPSNTNFLDTALFTSTSAAAENVVATFQDAAANFGNVITGVTTCTNASPTQCTLNAAYGFYTNAVITLSGATGAWASLNGTWTVTRIDGSNLTIPLNTTTFGSFSGQTVTGIGTYLQSGSVDIDVCWVNGL